MTRDHAGLDDAVLIDRWRSGDQRAASALVERHADALARFASSLGEREEVEELVQDTFVRAFQALDSFRGDCAFRTWLFTIERRLLVDRRRAGKRSRLKVAVSDGDIATEFDALDLMVADETAGAITQVVARLTPMQREVFTLRVVEGLSYKEIADLVGTTEGAARVHYHHALRTVKEHLDAA